MFLVDHKILSRVLTDFDSKHGKIMKVTIAQGKIHKYLRMTINYYSPGKLKLSMVNYIGKMLDYIP